MKRLSTLWWFALGLLTLLFMLIKLPASVLGALLSSKTEGLLQLAASEGNIWQGSAQPQLAGTPLAARLSWEWQPKALLKGRLAYKLHQDAGQAQVELGWNSILISNADLSLPATPLFALHKQTKSYALTGVLRIHSPEFHWATKGASGGLNIDWLGASSNLVPNVAQLGDYRINLTPQADRWQAQLSTVSGLLLINGQAQLQPGAGGNADIGLRAAPGSEVILGGFLNQVGQGEAGAERRLKFNF